MRVTMIAVLTVSLLAVAGQTAQESVSVLAFEVASINRHLIEDELGVQHDPLDGQLEVGVVREGELAVNGQAAQRRRADMEYASQDEVRILALRHQREIGFLP